MIFYIDGFSVLHLRKDHRFSILWATGMQQLKGVHNPGSNTSPNVRLIRELMEQPTNHTVSCFFRRKLPRHKMKLNLDMTFSRSRWWFHRFFLIFIPKIGEKIPFWPAYFSDGVGSTTNQMTFQDPPAETGLNFPVSQGPIWRWKPLRIVLNAKMQALRSANFQHFCSPFSMGIYRSCNKLAFPLNSHHLHRVFP